MILFRQNIYMKEDKPIFFSLKMKKELFIGPVFGAKEKA